LKLLHYSSNLTQLRSAMPSHTNPPMVLNFSKHFLAQTLINRCVTYDVLGYRWWWNQRLYKSLHF
jgi:hypothetical protein